MASKAAVSVVREDPFEDIMFSEENLSAQGYSAGYIHGCKQGLLEGFATGQTKGAQIGSEIGFYFGFTEYWISHLSEDNDRTLRTVVVLQEKLKEFPILNVSAEDYTTRLDQIRAKFKQIMSQLRVSCTYEPSKSQTVSF